MVSQSLPPRIVQVGIGVRYAVLGLRCVALRYVGLLTYKTNLLPFRHSSREGK